MEPRLDHRQLSMSPRAGAALRRFATALAALALLLSLPLSASATYPGSVDGRLAIGSSVDGNFDIYTFLPNGQALQRLTTDPLFDACPAWSADGKHIAWCHGVQRGGVIDVWTMKQDGSEKRQVTDLGRTGDLPGLLTRRVEDPLHQCSHRRDQLPISTSSVRMARGSSS